MNGKGMYYGIDGDVYEAIYINGEYIEWIFLLFININL
jgi:hypothetical protein